MKQLKWTISNSNDSISGVCRSVADVHSLLQKMIQTKISEIFVVINGSVMTKDEAISHAMEITKQEQVKYEQTHRAIKVKTGVCAFAANTKKIWVKR
jgi:hypothetical protein